LNYCYSFFFFSSKFRQKIIERH